MSRKVVSSFSPKLKLNHGDQLAEKQDVLLPFKTGAWIFLFVARVLGFLDHQIANHIFDTTHKQAVVYPSTESDAEFICNCHASFLSPMLHLPITVYRFDRRTKEYRFSHCLRSCVPGNYSPPAILNCSTGMGMLREGLELLKAAMRAPAVVLMHGSRTKVLSASGDEVISILPPTATEVPVIRAYEMLCINIPSCILHYRLRRDGTLVFCIAEEVNCLTCHVPETVCASYLKKHLDARAGYIRKLIRDRRVVVDMGARACVYSLETLHRRRVLVVENNNDDDNAARSI